MSLDINERERLGDKQYGMSSDKAKNLPYVHVSISPQDSMRAKGPGRSTGDKYIPYQENDPRSRRSPYDRRGYDPLYGRFDRRTSRPYPRVPHYPPIAYDPYRYEYPPYEDAGHWLDHGFPPYMDPYFSYDPYDRWGYGPGDRYEDALPYGGMPFDPYDPYYPDEDGFDPYLRELDWNERYRYDEPLGYGPHGRSSTIDGFGSRTPHGRAQALPPPRVPTRATSMSERGLREESHPAGVSEDDQPMIHKAEVIDMPEDMDDPFAPDGPARSEQPAGVSGTLGFPIRPFVPAPIGRYATTEGRTPNGAPMGSRGMNASRSNPYPNARGAQAPSPAQRTPGAPYGPARAPQRRMQPRSRSNMMGRSSMPRNPMSPSLSGSMAQRAQSRPGQPRAGSSSGIGAPLLDHNAIEQTTLFDQPPQSIKEGMKGVSKAHAKKRKIILIAAIALVVVGAALAVFFIFGPGASGISEEDGDGGSAQQSLGSIFGNSSSASSSGASGSNSGNTSSAGGNGNSGTGSSGSSASGSSGQGSQAGVVVYQYTAKLPSGVTYTAEETVTFNDAGEGEFVTTKMEFPTAEDCQAYTESQKKDYGSNYTIDAIDGATATVTVNISGLHQDREQYEMSLRSSVEDLVVLKK